MEKIINERKVRKLARKLAALDNNLRYNDPPTDEILKIEKELQKRGIMNKDGSYIGELPEAFVRWIEKLY